MSSIPKSNIPRNQTSLANIPRSKRSGLLEKEVQFFQDFFRRHLVHLAEILKVMQSQPALKDLRDVIYQHQGSFQVFDRNKDQMLAGKNVSTLELVTEANITVTNRNIFFPTSLL